MDKRFLDIGDGGGVLVKNIILILDADKGTKDKTTKEFLIKNRNSNVMPKKMITSVNSIVITEERGSVGIYSSPYSVSLIKKKANEKIKSIKPQSRKAGKEN